MIYLIARKQYSWRGLTGRFDVLLFPLKHQRQESGAGAREKRVEVRALSAECGMRNGMRGEKLWAIELYSRIDPGKKVKNRKKKQTSAGS